MVTRDIKDYLALTEMLVQGTGTSRAVADRLFKPMTPHMRAAVEECRTMLRPASGSVALTLACSLLIAVLRDRGVEGDDPRLIGLMRRLAADLATTFEEELT